MIQSSDLLCLGEPMLEFNQQPDGRYLAGHGGDTSNVAIAAARQGASVGYLTRIGRDTFGESFIDLWENEGVNTCGIEACPDGHTGFTLSLTALTGTTSAITAPGRQQAG